MLQRMAMIALIGVTLVSAKTYSFTVSQPSQVGNAQLKPGEYSIKVDGSQVVFADNARRTIEVPAKVETADQKFGVTSVLSSKADGTTRIQAIQIGGTKTKVVFE